MGAKRADDPAVCFGYYALIGACAMVHGLTLVTRNIRDFDQMVDTSGKTIKLLNPWE
jgi:predicted nucleic acid-binding protein